VFSVVIPVYNHARFLEKAVASAIESELVEEVLLCDDGSSDDSAQICAQIAKKNPEKVKDCSESWPKNVGAHHRLNQLCLQATQPWIRVLNSDDFFLPNSFETISLLSFTQKADFVSGSLLICDLDDVFIGTKKGIFEPEYPLPFEMESKALLTKKDFVPLLLNQNYLATTTNMAFKKSLFVETGGFRDFRYAHDWDFALRAAFLGTPIWSAAPLAVYRLHGKNTNLEISPHANGELCRLFASLLNEFPEIESIGLNKHLLQTNQHIFPWPATPQRSIRIPNHGKKGQILIQNGVPPEAMGNVLLGFAVMEYDFIVVSKSLADSNDAFRAAFWGNMAAIGKGIQLIEGKDKNTPSLVGRFMRCPQRQADVTEIIHLPDLKKIPGKISGADIRVEGDESDERVQRGWVFPELERIFHKDPKDRRPVIYVLPIFLAVGGVERNTIEVIRALQEKFRFIVITSERLSPAQGSLHWQLYELKIPAIDLAEIAGQEHHLNILTVLNQVIPADLIWICNGSPWLVENAVKLRRLFANVPIVDQEVYDTEEGWISHYDKKGIQSFDHFIAINSKIRAKFIEEIKIPAHRVYLIYPTLKEEPVLIARRSCLDREAGRRQIGLPAHAEKVFIFVGRLTDQKRPLSFLELVRSAQQMHPSVYFIMVGDGDVAGDCDRYIEKNGLGNILRISYHPRPPELMAICDGMIITSIYEGLPIAMLEALAVGIPVLATDVGDIRLVLEEYGCGLVSDSIGKDGKPQLQANAWHTFMKTLPTLQAAARSSTDQILLRFGSNNISTQYERAFSESKRSKWDEHPKAHDWR
jgi:glycosyltransferase involved in cell wall biosynthesis/GT2 family glycosyltransferase